jgi:hypothetical protein
MKDEVVHGQNTAKADDVIMELVKANRITIGEGMAMMIALESLASWPERKDINPGSEWIKRAQELTKLR